jgi:hypothetical protein
MQRTAGGNQEKRLSMCNPVGLFFQSMGGWNPSSLLRILFIGMMNYARNE